MSHKNAWAISILDIPGQQTSPSCFSMCNTERQPSQQERMWWHHAFLVALNSSYYTAGATERRNGKEWGCPLSIEGKLLHAKSTPTINRTNIKFGTLVASKFFVHEQIKLSGLLCVTNCSCSFIPSAKQENSVSNTAAMWGCYNPTPASS